MVFLLSTPIALAALLLAAHFYRWGESGLAATAVAFVALLLIRRRWVVYVLSAALICAALLWIQTTTDLVRVRVASNAPFLRLLLVLGAVTLGTAMSALVLRTEAIRAHLSGAQKSAKVAAAAFVLTFALLAAVQLKVRAPMLLAERFWAGSGWIEIFCCATYAALLTEKLLDPATQPKWRARLWSLFALVFFGQLFLGLAGVEGCLMTGTLHWPVPAVILAGPIYRGGGLFMVALFAITLLVVGPAWCSYLCYLGAIDGSCAGRTRQPKKLPSWAGKARLGILVATIAGAAILNGAGAPAMWANIAVGAFALIGLVIMVTASARSGTMAHCTVYCPLGLAANVLGKVSPFRLRITEGCSRCGACAKACRYGALSQADIKKGSPGLTCSLCGDCVGTCKTKNIEYRFVGIRGQSARHLFVALVASLHAVFLAVARI